MLSKPLTISQKTGAESRGSTLGSDFRRQTIMSTSLSSSREMSISAWGSSLNSETVSDGKRMLRRPNLWNSFSISGRDSDIVCASINLSYSLLQHYGRLVESGYKSSSGGEIPPALLASFRVCLGVLYFFVLTGIGIPLPIAASLHVSAQLRYLTSYPLSISAFAASLPP
jgi:hypothetical protein